MFQDMNEQSEEIPKLTGAADMLRSRLVANSYFDSLQDKRKRELLRGRHAFLEPLEAIAVKSGTDLATFRWTYRFLSNHAHGLPMAFHRLGEERGRGVHTRIEDEYTSLWLNFASGVLDETRTEFEALFAGLARESALVQS
jgi:hypothetical protein